MSNKRELKTDQARLWVYQIRVNGHLGHQWKDWFEDLSVSLEDNGDTVLTGSEIDQAALHGLLKKVRDLGIPLVSVRRIQPEPENISIELQTAPRNQPKKRGTKMKIIKTLSALMTALLVTLASGQVFAETDSIITPEPEEIEKRHTIGSSLYMLANFESTDEPGNYFQLNYGYRLSQKSNLIVEAVSWTYYEPLGKYEQPDNKHYPGKVTAYGVGLGYQRFFWKNAFATIQATPFYQIFDDDEKGKTQAGFQLYLQMKLGYRFEFLENWFVEPALSFNYWPINTNIPESFKPMEDDAPNYFLFEPNLHFGYRF